MTLKPPPAYLLRVTDVHTDALRSCYTDPTVWQHFDPACVTLCSPDPQALRAPDGPLNLVEVTLPTNFKAARFESEAHTAMLRRLEGDIEAARYEGQALPVKLCMSLGAAEADLVPFEKYAAAAAELAGPSSAARALAAGATHIERVDRIVQGIGAQKALRHPAVDETVALIDARFAANRKAAA